MIYIENASIGVHPLLPALWQRTQIVLDASRLVWHRTGPAVARINPSGTPGCVINEEGSTVGGHLHRPAWWQRFLLAAGILQEKDKPD